MKTILLSRIKYQYSKGLMQISWILRVGYRTRDSNVVGHKKTANLHNKGGNLRTRAGIAGNHLSLVNLKLDNLHSSTKWMRKKCDGKSLGQRNRLFQFPKRRLLIPLLRVGKITGLKMIAERLPISLWHLAEEMRRKRTVALNLPQCPVKCPLSSCRYPPHLIFTRKSIIQLDSCLPE